MKKAWFCHSYVMNAEFVWFWRMEGKDSLVSLICRMLATNYFGAFCLTKVLLPLLENSPVPSRVVNVTSFTHRNGNILGGLTFSLMMHMYIYVCVCGVLCYSYYFASSSSLQAGRQRNCIWEVLYEIKELPICTYLWVF